MKNSKPKRLTALWVVAVGVVAAVIVAIIGLVPSKDVSALPEVVVYKSPSCGCCNKWVRHLRDNGFQVETHNRRDMATVKRQIGVPGDLASCHTVKVGGYIIEGHVPADLIAKMLKERPDIVGLAVPGMPIGSPGMEGPVHDRYSVISFYENGGKEIYAQR